MANPTGRGGFKKGKSGNPGGRPRMRKQARLRHPEILGMRDNRMGDLAARRIRRRQAV